MTVSPKQLEEVMARRLDEWLATQDKTFVGSMVNGMVSGLTEQISCLAEAQKRTERRLGKVGTGLSEVRESLAEAAARE